MKLRALDQINVSAVQPDSLRPGQEFEVSNALGRDLLKVHPAAFEPVGPTPMPAATPDDGATKPKSVKAKRA